MSGVKSNGTVCGTALGARLLAILEDTPDLISLADLRGNLLYLNRAGRRLLGVSEEGDLRGVTIAMAHPQWAYELVQEEGIPTALREGIWRGETAILRHDGREIPVSQVIYTHRGPDGEVQYLATTMHDISDLKRVEDALMGSNQRLEVLTQTARQLLASDGPRQVIHDLCYRVMEFLDCQVFLNFLVEGEGLRLNAHHGISEPTVKELRWLDFGSHICGTVARDRRPVVIHAQETSADVFRALDIQAYACYPLLAQGKLVGTLAFGTRTRGRFSEEDLSLIRAVSEQVALAVDHHNLLEAANARAAEAEEGKRVLEALMEYIPEAIIIGSAESHRIERVSAYNLTLSRRPREELVGMLLPDWMDRWNLFMPDGRTRPPPEVCPMTRAMQKGETIIDQELVMVTPDDQAIPILINAGPIRDREGQITGGVLAWRDISIRKEAERRKESHLQRLHALLRISQSVLATSTMEELLQRVVDASLELIEAKVGVSGYRSDSGPLRFCSAQRPRGGSECRCMPFIIERGGVYMELLSRTGTLRLGEEELRRHPSWWGLPENHPPLKGLLGARLVSRSGEPKGLIMVSDKDEGEFTPEDEALLGQLAAIASLGLQHIEARTETEKRADDMEAIITSMTEGLLIYDLEGRIVRSNPAGLQSLGFDPRGMTWKQIKKTRIESSFCHLDGREVTEEESPHKRALQGERVRGEIYRVTDPKGKVYTILISASPLYAAGKISGALAVWHDITERERLYEETQRYADEMEAINTRLKAQTRELEEAVRELESFSYTVSHDLRSPLRSIDGFARILIKELLPQLSPTHREYLELVRESAQQMGSLIEGLLAFARLGRQSIKRRQVEPSMLVEEALEELRPLMEGRVVRVEVGDLPPRRADPVLLKQVYINLLSNALKYTRSRGVAHIEVGYRGEDDVYFVRDNGVGFDMRYAPKLFGVFQRLHREDEYEGTGVGLAIVQRIIHRHGGRVWTEAMVDMGATFYFTIPERT